MVSPISPAAAINDINNVAAQLRTGNISGQQEAALEQQLVKDISSANPSANWGMIATITDDLWQPSSTAAAAIDIQALDRMVSPTTRSTLSSAIGTIAQQLRGQSPFPDGITTLTANSLPNSTAVSLPSTVGMFNGDKITIKLDNGQAFNTTITTILGNTVNLAKRLPSQASSGTFFTNKSQQQRDNTGTNTANAASQTITTSLSTSAALGASTISVASGSGMNTGDPIQVDLLDGSTLDTTITAIVGSTTLTADGLTGAIALQVGNATVGAAGQPGFHNGDSIAIKLDNGIIFNTIVASIAGNTINIAAPLPSQATTGATLIDTNNVGLTLATPLPVAAVLGNSVTDTANVTASTTSVSFPTLLTSDGAAQSTSFMVASPGALAAGDPVQISLDNGSVFNTTIANVTNSTVTLARPLPSAATVANGATLTDNANLAPNTGSASATVAIAPQIQAMLQLQLNVLIGTANANADVPTLQSIEGSLISATLTTAQFQLDLASLVKLATSGLSSGSKLNILA
jgi:hypothetical protein